MAIFSVSTPPPRHVALERRQTSALRLIASISMFVTAYYVFDSIRWGDYSQATLSFLYSLVFAGVIAAAGRFRAVAGHIVLMGVCLMCLQGALAFGRGVGNQNLLLSLGPMAALLLSVKRPYGVIFYSTLSSVLIILIELGFPLHINPGAPLLDQLNLPFMPGFGLGGNAINIIVNTVSLEFGIGLCTYFAMHWAAQSEAAVAREYSRSELLLQNLLPATIASRLKDNPDEVIAENFESISILFADVVNFTPTSAQMKPADVISFLSRLFGEFDTLAKKHGLEKIKTIGDCYMVAGGMPVRSEGHAQEMADMALDMIVATQKLTAEFDDQLSIRIGLHVGPAMAGVIGHNKPHYDVWGDTINVAARMESHGIPGRIQITPEVKNILGLHYDFESRGVVDIKGKGPMDLYFLVGKSESATP